MDTYRTIRDPKKLKLGQPPIMTAAQETLFWQSVDENRGPGSVWIQDKVEAFRALCREWASKQLSDPPTLTQLQGFLYNVSQRNCKRRCKKRDIFVEGTSIVSLFLDPPKQPQISTHANAGMGDAPHPSGRNPLNRPGSTVAAISTNPFGQDHGVVTDNTGLGKEYMKYLNRLYNAPRMNQPTDETLRELHLRTITAIQRAAESVRAAPRDVWVLLERPHLFGAVHSADTESLKVFRIYGAELSPGALWGTITRAQSHSVHSPVGLGVVLRALLGVALADLVFEKEIDALFPELSWSKATDELSAADQVLLEGCPTMCERYILVHNLEIVRLEIVQNHHNLEETANELAGKLNNILEVCLKENLIRADEEATQTWRDNLKEVFITALDLKAHLSLAPGAFNFRWFDADEPFDPRSMAASEDDPSTDTDKLRLTLFPGLVRIAESSDGSSQPEEEVIFEAFVLRQTPIADT